MGRRIDAKMDREHYEGHPLDKIDKLEVEVERLKRLVAELLKRVDDLEAA